MQSTFFVKLRIKIMRFVLQSYKGNIGDNKCNKATNFFESNISIDL